jgi:hypothetical protein
VTRGERRDFLLDSGAVTTLAHDEKQLVAYKQLLARYLAGSLHIPSPVLSEIHTGEPKYDAVVDRMVNRISRAGVEVYIPGSVETDKRAGELRYLAQKALDEANPKKPQDKISGVDALLVAIAERRSRLYPVTIVTTDPVHIKALVAATGAKNIEVDVPS